MLTVDIHTWPTKMPFGSRSLINSLTNHKSAIRNPHCPKYCTASPDNAASTVSEYRSSSSSPNTNTMTKTSNRMNAICARLLGWNTITSSMAASVNSSRIFMTVSRISIILLNTHRSGYGSSIARQFIFYTFLGYCIITSLLRHN